MKFVSLTQVMNGLKIDSDAPAMVADLENLIEAASLALARYLQNLEAYQDSSGDIPQDSAGDPIVDADVQRATIVLIGMLLRDPDGAEQEKWQQGYLPFAVTALIYPLRPLTMA